MLECCLLDRKSASIPRRLPALAQALLVLARMKTVDVLLGCAERRIISPVEVLLHDVCYEYATINCLIVARIDEFVRKACAGSLDLLILAPDHLSPAPGRRYGFSTDETIQTVQALKTKVLVPLIILGGVDEGVRFMEAGADAVVSLPLRGETLREVLRQTLQIPEPVIRSNENPQSPGGLWWRRLQKLVSTS